MYAGYGEHGRWDYGTPSPTRASAEYAELHGTILYALRVADGTVKIGITKHLLRRIKAYTAGAGVEPELLAIRQGDAADEHEIHRQLAAHAKHGREWYHPHPEVLDLVNQWRHDLGMEPVTA